MRRIRDLLAIILLLLIAALTFIVFSFNPDHYKSEIERWAANQGWQLNYQRSFWQISSPFSWHLNNVTFGRVGFMALQTPQIDLHINPKALLSGELEITSLSLDDPSLKIASRPQNDRRPTLPWLKTIRIDNLTADNAHIIWIKPDRQPLAQVSRGQLQIRHWQFNNQGYANDQWKLFGSAQALHYDGYQLEQPQGELSWKDNQLNILDFSTNLAHGQVTANGYWKDDKLHLAELNFDRQRLDKTTLNALLTHHWPTRLRQIHIDNLSFNTLNIQSQYQKQPISVNDLDGEIDNISLKVNQPDSLKGQFQFTINNLLFAQWPLEQVTLNGLLNGQSLKVLQLKSNLQPGTLSSSFQYSWGVSPTLNVDQFTLNGTTMALSDHFIKMLKILHSNHAGLSNLIIQQADFNQIKLLSYLSDWPLSAQKINSSMSQLHLIQDNHWQSINQLWRPQTSLFIQLPSLAYKGLILSNLSVNIGPDESTDTQHFSLYGELPQGQLQWKGQINLNEPEHPWNGHLSSLILDVSPIALLSGNPTFKIGGDLELHGSMSGQLSQGLASVKGDLTATSTQLAFNRDLAPLFNKLLHDPRISLPANRQTLIQGAGALWQKGSTIPVGSTVFNQLNLHASIENGAILFDQTTVASAPYNWLISGQIDLATQRYTALGIGLTDGQCVLLNRIVDGPWQSPQIRIDQYQLNQSYHPRQNTFIHDPQGSGRCLKASLEPAPSSNP